MSGLVPCVITPKVVSGPNIRLQDKTVSREESHARIRACQEEVGHAIKRKSYKNKEKTPLAVKIAAGIMLMVAVIGFLKYKLKK